MIFTAVNNPLAPNALEASVTIIGLLYLAFILFLMIFGVVVMLTWRRKNKLRIIELEFEERAIDQRRAQKTTEI